MKKLKQEKEMIIVSKKSWDIKANKAWNRAILKQTPAYKEKMLLNKKKTY